MFNKSKIKIAFDIKIPDTGSTGHFVLPGTPVTKISPAIRTLIINLPDGKTIKSTHTRKLAIQWLPDESKIAHIVPGLVHSSLVYIKVLCDAGCKVIYEGRTCDV